MGTLPNPNLPVTEERLQEFYQQIKPYLGLREMPSGDMDEIVSPKPVTANGGHRYSTEEQIVGTWIDGSTIYEKTIDFGALPNATTKTVAHNITNIDKLVNLQGRFSDTNGQMATIPFSYPDGATYNVGIYATATSIAIKTGTDRSSQNAYVTIQYTKTTA